MIEMGWNPYQNDHEDANGQFEMNWDYTDCLTTADKRLCLSLLKNYLLLNQEQLGLQVASLTREITEHT